MFVLEQGFLTSGCEPWNLGLCKIGWGNIDIFIFINLLLSFSSWWQEQHPWLRLHFGAQGTFLAGPEPLTAELSRVLTPVQDMLRSGALKPSPDVPCLFLEVLPHLSRPGFLLVLQVHILRTALGRREVKSCSLTYSMLVRKGYGLVLVLCAI